MSSDVMYCDRSVRELLRDYLLGSPRAEDALDFALAALPGGRMKILDLGCGIGWSSAEVARNYPEARIRAVDLRPELVATAQSVFGEETRICFQVKDFINEQIEGHFDAILLLDVYQHFPAGDRPLVHERLNKLLAEDGRLILSVPTPGNERESREREPWVLGHVDEEVTYDDLRTLAEDIGGREFVKRDVPIGRTGDFMHVLIQRRSLQSGAAGRFQLEGRKERAGRLRQRLGIRWTDEAGFVAAHEGPPVCIALESFDVVSETFIRAHLERLPAFVHVWQGNPPRRTHSGRSLLGFPLRATARLVAGMVATDPSRVEDMFFARLPAGARARLYSRYLRRHSIQLVMAEYGFLAVGLLAGCRRAGIPLVPHFHGYDAFEDDVVEQYGDAYRELFQAGWPVVVVSESMRRQLIALGADEDQVCLNYYGVDLTEFHPGESVPGLVVAVGRFVDKKAPELTLLAFAKTLERVPSAQLVMIGDGPLRPTIERLISALGLESSVSLPGARGHADVAEAMRRASVFVQHSVTAPNGDREGTPVAVLEAGASGVPVVATRHEGIAEVVVHGETGILVDEGDTDAMGAAVAELLLDPSQAERLGRAARRRVEGRHSIELTTERLWTILKPPSQPAT